MNYLEPEDDGYGPVPMEVGARKETKARRAMAKEIWQKFGKVRQKQRVQQEQRVRQRQ